VNMGQDEIIAFLKKARLCGDDRYFSIREIKEGLDGGSQYTPAISRAIWPLVRTGVIECKQKGDAWDWYRGFRLVDKYVKEDD